MEEGRRYRLSRRKLAALLAALAFLPLGWIAAERGLSAGAAHMLQEHLDHWLVRNGPADLDAWGRAESAFLFSSRRTPKDPHLLQQGGQLYVWRAEMEKEDAPRREQFLDQAIELYRDSLRIRPAWPYAWMGFAFAKAQRSALDREFQHAFATALQLGPREDTIQIEMTRLGLRIWPALSFENQERLAQNVRNALMSQPDKILGVIRTEHREALICNALQDEPALESICSKLGLRE